MRNRLPNKTLVALSNVASVYRRSGRFKTAERYQRKALDGFRRVLGPGQRRTISHQTALAEIVMADGRYEEAETLLRHALEYCLESSIDNPVYAKVLERLSSTLMAQDRGAEAEPLCRDLLAWRKQGKSSALTGKAHLWLARSLMLQENLDEAGKQIELSLELVRGEGDDTDWVLQLGMCLKDIAAIRRGEKEDAVAAIQAYRQLQSQQKTIREYTRQIVLSEVRSQLAKAGIDADDH